MKNRLAALSLALALSAPCARAANWELSFVNNAPLPAPTSGVVLETSCVTYVGPVGAAYRFISGQQNHDHIVRFDVTFNDNGGIANIANVVNIAIDDHLDFEGVAFTNATRNSVFLSEENNPGIREISVATGHTLQTAAIPSVFANRRDNRGFESLTRTLDGTTMWTANEEALTVDGPVSTAAAGTTVRLLKFNVDGNSLSSDSQFAYKVEPIFSSVNPSRSGLNDLMVMPDGTLISLERANANSTFRNHIFEINFDDATDISVGATANGLVGKNYKPVDKELLWMGTVNPPGGQNFEGLGLGPRLPNGTWAVLGVIDSSDGGADNTVVAFSAVANTTADFNSDGFIDGEDFLAWQRGSGKEIGALLAEGDGDRDGDVDSEDLQLWQAAIDSPPTHAVPEPSGALLAATAAACIRRTSRRRVSTG